MPSYCMWRRERSPANGLGRFESHRQMAPSSVTRGTTLTPSVGNEVFAQPRTRRLSFMTRFAALWEGRQERF